jgi:hypothetical protein
MMRDPGDLFSSVRSPFPHQAKAASTTVPPAQAGAVSRAQPAPWLPFVDQPQRRDSDRRYRARARLSGSGAAAEISRSVSLPSRARPNVVSNDLSRVIAVDWSGAEVGAARRIWIAEVVDGELRRLESGRSREQVAELLVEEGRRSPGLVVGLDFAFAFPAWFAAEQGVTSAPALWERAAREGDGWLRRCDPPFWGRRGKRRGTDDHDRLYRRTERAVPRVKGIAPKSVFQVGGAGAVGTGSVRGMRLLARLHEAGWRVWPFTDGDDRDAPTVLEIYPRLLTGPVNKSSFSQRAEYLRHRFPRLTAGVGVMASSSEDAFDAAVSAMVMSEHAAELQALPDSRDEIDRIEGAIWWPYARRGEAPALDLAEARA